MAKDLSQPIREVVLTVQASEAEMRLDHFLGDRIFWRSRTDLQHRIKTGTVLVNDGRAKPSTRLHARDVVRVKVRPEDMPDQDPSTIDVDVLFEDDAMIVVDKQAGLVVHPTGRHVYDTLMNALHLRYRDDDVEPHVVHRLDRNTSGVLVVAKSFATKQVLQDAFQNREPDKRYLALCVGTLDAGLEVDAPLGRDEEAEIRLKMCVRDDGQPSRTAVEVVERFDTHTLVRAKPITGRQHQIRVHLAHIGLPIVADPLYGDPRSVGGDPDGEPLLRRQALHAAELRITHPVSGEEMEFATPLPEDMAACVEVLRGGGTLHLLADEQSSRWA